MIHLLIHSLTHSFTPSCTHSVTLAPSGALQLTANGRILARALKVVEAGLRLGVAASLSLGMAARSVKAMRRECATRKPVVGIVVIHRMNAPTRCLFGDAGGAVHACHVDETKKTLVDRPAVCDYQHNNVFTHQ